MFGQNSLENTSLKTSELSRALSSEPPLHPTSPVQNEDNREGVINMLLDGSSQEQDEIYRLTEFAINNQMDNEDAIKTFVEERGDISQEKVCELMKAAIKNQHLKLVNLLLQRYKATLTPDAEDNYKLFLLEAVQHNAKDVFNSLLNHLPCTLTPYSYEICRLLEYAIKNTNEVIFNTLLSRIKCPLALQKINILSLLTTAVEHQNENIIKSLLPHLPVLCVSDSNSLLADAVRQDNEKIVEMLLSRTPPLLRLRERNYFALLEPVQKNKENLVKMLLGYLPPLNSGLQIAVLRGAINNGHENILTLLLEHKHFRSLSKENSQYLLSHAIRAENLLSDSVRYPLMDATPEKHENIVNILLRRTSTLTPQDICELLVVAIKSAKEHIVKLLVDYILIGMPTISSHDVAGSEQKDSRGTIVNMLLDASTEQPRRKPINALKLFFKETPRRDGYYALSPIAEAVEVGRENVLRMLLDAKASVHEKHPLYGTLLAQAIEHDYKDENKKVRILQTLLEYGACITRETKELAEKHGVALLLDKAARGADCMKRLGMFILERRSAHPALGVAAEYFRCNPF